MHQIKTGIQNLLFLVYFLSFEDQAPEVILSDGFMRLMLGWYLTALLQFDLTTVTLCYMERRSKTLTKCRLLRTNWQGQFAVLQGPPVPLSSNVSSIGCQCIKGSTTSWHC